MQKYLNEHFLQYHTSKKQKNRRLQQYQFWITENFKQERERIGKTEKNISRIQFTTQIYRDNPYNKKIRSNQFINKKKKP